MSLNASLLITPLIDFVTGKIVEAGTKMDPAKLVARAQELIAVNTALIAINAGDPNGLPELQAAFTTTALAPGEALALQSLFAALSNQVALVISIKNSTVLGAEASNVMGAVLATATSTAQAYVVKYSQTPAA
jgi:hypothetical protein